MKSTKKHSVMSWLEEYWPASTPFLAVYLTIVLVLFILTEICSRVKLDFLLFVLGVLIALIFP